MGRGLEYRRYQAERAKALARARLRWLLSGGRRALAALTGNPCPTSGTTRGCLLQRWVGALYSQGPTPALVGRRAATPALCSCWKGRKEWLDAPRCAARPPSGVRSPSSGPCRPPVRVPAVDPRWLTDTVRALCGSIARTGRTDAHGVLADALEEAGCDRNDVLAHLRDLAITHDRDCWVIDWLLGHDPAEE